MKKLMLFCICILTLGALKSQNAHTIYEKARDIEAISKDRKYIDSSLFFLDQSIRISRENKDSIILAKAYVAKGKIYFNSYKSGIIFFDSALFFAKKAHLLEEEITSYIYLARMYRHTDYVKAETAINNGYNALSKKNLPVLEAELCAIQSWILENRGKSEVSIKNQIQLLEKNSDCEECMIISHISLVRIYMFINDPIKAKEHLATAKKISQKISDIRYIIKTLILEGDMAVQFNNDLVQAESIYIKVLDIVKETWYISEEVVVQQKLANIFIKQQKFEEAEKIYQTCYKLFLNNQDKLSEALVLNSLGNIYNHKNQYDKALSYHLQALEINKKIVFKRGIRDTYIQLAELCEKHSYLKDALTYYRLYSLYQDTLLNEEKIKAVKESEIKYETKQKELLIQDLKYTGDIQKLRNRNKNTWLLILFIILISILLSIILYYQKNKIRILDVQQKLYRSNMNPHFLSNCITSMQGFLYSPDFSTEILKEYMSKFTRLLRHSIESTLEENISLEDEIQVLRDYVDLQNSLYNNIINFEMHYDEILLQHETIIPSFILQPLIENSIKYGQRNSNRLKIDLTITQEKNNLIFVLTDDGIGIQESEKKDKKKSFAMRIISERLQILEKKYRKKCVFNISNNIPHGTIIHIIIPIL